MTKKKPKISYSELAGEPKVPGAGNRVPESPAKAEGTTQPPAVATPVHPAPIAEKPAKTPKRTAKPRAPKVAAEKPQPVAPPVKAPEVVPEIAMKPRVSSPVEVAAVLRTSDPRGNRAYATPEPEPPTMPDGARDLAPGTPALAAPLPALDPTASIDDYATALMRRLAAMAPVEVEDEAEIERDTRPLRDRLRTREGVADLLMFRIGPEIFATELAMVEEAVALPEIHHLPEMPAAMLGAFNLRGRLTPVYSPAHVIGVPLRGTAQAALLVRANGRRLGLAVDDVEDVLQVDLATVREAPGIDDADGILLGVAHHGQDLVAVLDAAALVAACLTGHAMETA